MNHRVDFKKLYGEHDGNLRIFSTGVQIVGFL